MRGHRLLRARRRGDAIVEFALLAPMLVLILFGILEVGRVIDAWIVVHNAAREGARAGALVYADDAANAAALGAANTYLASTLSPRTDIPTPPVATASVTSTSIDVTAEAEVELYTPLFQSLLGSSAAQVRASASMRRQ
jgi:Flp pilus assembly protein TadG